MPFAGKQPIGFAIPPSTHPHTIHSFLPRRILVEHVLQGHGVGSHCGLSAFKAWGLINSHTLLRVPWQMGHRKKMKRSTNLLNRENVVFQITNLSSSGSELNVQKNVFEDSVLERGRT